MFLELIASFAAGIAAAGLVLIVNSLTGRRLPRWLMPIAAAGAMIGYGVWSEYSWAGRTVGGLPPGVVEVSRVDERKPYKPWTYLAPQASRLIAADVGGAATRDDAPALRLVTLYLFARWQPTHAVPVLIDCAAPARTEASDATLADPAAAQWRALAADDPLIVVICGNGGGA